MNLYLSDFPEEKHGISCLLIQSYVIRPPA